jgi:membrane-bound serine protease (ClpP class)
MNVVLFFLLLALSLSSSFASEKPMQNGSIIVLPVSGPVSEVQFFFLRRVLKNAESAHAAALILDMDTPGGDLKSTEKIVQMLGKSPIPTYTYVNSNAGSAGALIALGTKKIFMSPVSAIGAAAPVAGSGQEIPVTMNAKIVSYYSGYFRSVAQKNGYHAELVDGFMNLDKEVKIGDEIINPKGSLLTLSAQEATRPISGRSLLASGIATDIADVVKQCGLPVDKLILTEPSGFESLAQWITLLAPFLLLGGVLGAYLELKAPGFGVPGIISAICFLLFFGGHYIAGLTGFEMLAIFALGVVFIVLELVFFPGVLVVALAGAAMIVASLFLAMADFYPAQPIAFSYDFFLTPMLNLSITILLACIFIGLASRYLPALPLFRNLSLSSNLAPGPSLTNTISNTGTASSLFAGNEGIAISPLHPTGRAQIGQEHFDVLSEGEFIAVGTPIQILKIMDQKIIVGPRIQT